MTEKKKTKFVQGPEYAGGQKEMSKFIYANLQYPAAALEAGVEGVVLVEYDIDYHGNVTATRVLQGLGYGCDEEACRVIRLLKFHVGKNRGLHVIFHKKTSVQFKKPLQKAPAQQVQIQYNYSTGTTAEDKPAAPAGEVYSYSITFTPNP